MYTKALLLFATFILLTNTQIQANDIQHSRDFRHSVPPLFVDDNGMAHPQKTPLRLNEISLKTLISADVAHTQLTLTINSNRRQFKTALQLSIPEDTILLGYEISTSEGRSHSTMTAFDGYKPILKPAQKLWQQKSAQTQRPAKLFRTEILDISPKLATKLTLNYIQALKPKTEGTYTFNFPVANLSAQIHDNTSDVLMKAYILVEHTEKKPQLKSFPQKSGSGKFKLTPANKATQQLLGKRYVLEQQTLLTFGETQDIVVETLPKTDKSTKISTLEDRAFFSYRHGISQLTFYDKPESIDIFWDTSLSAKTHHDEQTHILAAHLSKLPESTTIRLHRFSFELLDKHVYANTRQGQKSLFEKLHKTTYQGGTSFYWLNNATDLALGNYTLLFSDGRSSLNQHPLPKHWNPIYSIAPASSNTVFLSTLSASTRGIHLDHRYLSSKRINRFIGAKPPNVSVTNINDIEALNVQFFAQTPPFIEITGQVIPEETQLQLKVNEAPTTTISLNTRASNKDNIAAFRLSQQALRPLLIQPLKNKQAIQAIGMKYAIETPFTTSTITSRHSHQEKTITTYYASGKSEFHKGLLSSNLETPLFEPNAITSILNSSKNALSSSERLTLISSLSEHYPTHDYLMDKQAKLYAEEKEYMRAITILEHLINLHPSDTQRRYHLSRTWLDYGEYMEEHHFINKAKTIYQDLKEMDNMLGNEKVLDLERRIHRASFSIQQ